MLRRSSIAALAAAALLAGGCSRPSGPAPQLILIAWDGAADWVVDRLLAEGKLPHLAHLVENGVAAEHSLSSFPSKTAVAFASLYTGCWPDRHGVTGNSVIPRPAGEHDLLESMRGYSSEALHAEPIFVTAAKAGRKVAVLSATQSYPAAPHLAELRRAGVPEGRYLSFSGFEHEIAESAMLEASALRPVDQGWDDVDRVGEARELRFRVGESGFQGLVFDDPSDPVEGLDTVLIRSLEGGLETRLRPRPANAEAAGWSRAFLVRSGDLEGNTFFRLFDLAPDGSRFALYQRQASALKGTWSGDQLAEYRAAYAGFHDPAASLYRNGRLGLPIPVGGDGRAEERYLELAAFDARQLERGTRFALESWQPDALFHYTSITDDAGHLWVGLLDPQSPAHDPRLAERIWPYYARIYQQLDAWLGSIFEHARPGAVIAVVSDHGMAGAHRYVHLNRALQEAGLLARRADGRIDLARTRILAAESSFFLRVNSRSWKRGIVPAAEHRAVVEAAAEALLAIEDPQTGGRVVTRVMRPERFPELGIAGAASGDLYFDLAPGYYPKKGAADGSVSASDWPWGEGAHGYWPERRDMHAIFYAMGSGLRSGRRVAPIRHVDVAPTLARAVGIPAPFAATGRVVEEMLNKP